MRRETILVVLAGLGGAVLTGCRDDGLADGLPDEVACHSCHGSVTSDAPPVSVSESTETTAVGVGAHQAHLVDGDLRAAVACDECHRVPEKVDDPDHVDPLPAEVLFGTLAAAEALDPNWDRSTATCQNVYCHGPSLEGGKITEPIWTTVDGSQKQCDSCHGDPPPFPHHPTDTCDRCHPETVAADRTILVGNGLHINGEVDVIELDCDSCHGADGEAAPPTDTLGNSETTAAGVGAHASHLRESDWRPAIECEECHVVPEEIDDDGHRDSPLPAELTWGPLASADGARPGYTSPTCRNVYCHGATLASNRLGGEGLVNEPQWTLVDDSQSKCDSCHGMPPITGHVTRTDCELCHSEVSGGEEVIIAPELHINGELDVDELDCWSCHGDITDEDPTPPLDTEGNSETTARGVGAHREHLATADWRAAITCDACHLVPTAMEDPGHVDSALPAELTWGPLAAADGAVPDFDGTRCNNVYCHGATLTDGAGAITAPEWTVVDDSQDACGTCHGLPPQGNHLVVPGDNCGPCHYFTDLVADDPATHIDGKVDGQYSCGDCHGVAPATGAHLAHYGDTSDPDLTAYDDLSITGDFYPDDAPFNQFGCGNCHPLDTALHNDGLVQVELWSPAAPPATLKAKNPATATWDGATCSDVYCHSSGQETPIYVTSPAWDTTLPPEKCGSCHDNPPAYPTGGAGTATANTHLMIADDGWEYGHFGGLPGPWHTSYHGGSFDSASPMTCQTCHYDTVAADSTGPGGFYYLDTSGNYDLGGSLAYSCTTGGCHTDLPGEQPQGFGAVQYETHVDGNRQVTFDPRSTFTPGTTGLPAPPDEPTYPQWVTAVPFDWVTTDSTVDGATWSFHLGAAGYDPATKTCTNVACHLKQSFGAASGSIADPLVWGLDPVGNATCNACHQF